MDSPLTEGHSERFETKYYSKDSQFGRAFPKNPLVLAVLEAIPAGSLSILDPKLVNSGFLDDSGPIARLVLSEIISLSNRPI